VSCLYSCVEHQQVLMATMCMNGLFTLLFAASSSHDSMILLRFLTGVGCGGSVPAVFALPAEVVPASFRGSAITVVATCWMVGSILVASFAWALIPSYGWRPFAVACAVPPLVCALVVLLLLHESPRFLLARGNVAQATQVLGAMECFSALLGKASLQVASVELRPLQTQGLPGEALQEGGETVSIRRGLEASTFNAQGVQKVFRAVVSLWHPRLRRRTVLLCVVWFGICFGWYGLSNWIPSLLKAKEVSLCWSGEENPSCLYETSLVVALFNAPGNLLSLVLVDRIGRNWLMSSSVVVAASAVMLAGMSADSTVTGVFFCLFNAVSVISWNVLDVLSVEMFPTVLRGVAMGLMSSLGRVAAMIAQPVFAAASPEAALFVSSVALAVAGGATMMLPDLACAPLDDL
jgi:putative MFS transporter